jgi:hypothetical protein
MRRIILFIVLLSVTISCGTHTTVFNTPKPSITNTKPFTTPTKTPQDSLTTLTKTTPTSTATSTVSPTPSPTIAYAKESLIPELVTICPENPYVPLDELGLDSQTRLVIKPYTVGKQDDLGYLILSPDMEKPFIVLNIIQPGTINHGYNISPNGQWVLFRRLKKEENDEIPWISSLDGKQQWKLDSSGQMSGGTWLDDNSILLYDREGNPRKVIDPFTKEEEILTGLPKMQVEGVGAAFFRIEDHTYLLYQSGWDVRLFDPINKTDILVFQWMKEDVAPFLDSGIFYKGNGRFLAWVDRSYGFDLSPEMTIDEIQYQNNFFQIMQQVIFKEKNLPISPSYPLPANAHALLLDQWDGKNNLGKQPRFYWFDYSTGILKDYCFEELSGSNISPDGKFVAFTKYEEPSYQPVPALITILNIETGYRTIIEDYQFIGWGRENK